MGKGKSQHTNKKKVREGILLSRDIFSETLLHFLKEDIQEYGDEFGRFSHIYKVMEKCFDDLLKKHHKQILPEEKNKLFDISDLKIAIENVKDFCDKSQTFPFEYFSNAVIREMLGYKEPGKIKKKMVENAIENFNLNKNEIKAHIIHMLLKPTRENKDRAKDLMAKFLLKNFDFKTVRYEEQSEPFIYFEGIYEAMAFTFVDEFVSKLCDEAYSRQLSNAVLDKIKSETYIREEDFEEKNPSIRAVENGILNILTGELKPFTPQHYFFAKHPVTYNPAAKCPKILKFIEEVLQPDDIPAFQEYLGYTLFSDYPFHKGVVMYGVGRNGKGAIIALHQALLGSNSHTALGLKMLTENNFAIANLKGKLMNVCGEIAGTMIKDSSHLKMIMGADEITADRKNLPCVTFKNYAKPFFMGNEIPYFRDDSIGFWSRLLYFELKNQFYTEKEIALMPEEQRSIVKKADENLIENLVKDKEEMSGYLNWLLEGVQRLFKNHGFSYNLTGEQVRNIMLMKSNPYVSFVKDCVKECQDGFITKESIREAFLAYALENGLKQTINEKRLRDAIWNTFHPSEEQRTELGTRRRGYIGLELKVRDAAQGTQPTHHFSIRLENYITIREPELAVQGVQGVQAKKIDSKGALKDFIITKHLETKQPVSMETIVDNSQLSDSELEAALYDLSLIGEIFQPVSGKWLPMR